MADTAELRTRTSGQATPLTVGLLGAAVALLGGCVLAAWWAGFEQPTRISAGFTPMKPNAALGLLLSGLALVLWSRRSGHPRTAPAVGVLAAAVIAIGVLTLGQYASGVDLRVDRLLLPADGDTGATNPGRPALMTAVVLVGVGVGLVAMVAGRNRLVRLASALIVTIGYVAILGYLYGVSSLYQVGAYTQMAAHTAAAAFLLGLALELAIPRGGLGALLQDSGSAGRMTRTLIPAAAITIPVLGWMALLGQRQGWYQPEFTAAAVAATVGVIGSALTIRAATAALRSDEQQRSAHRQLERLAATLEQRVEDRTRAIALAAKDLSAVLDAAPVGMIRLDAAGRCFAVNAEWRRMTGLTNETSSRSGWHHAIHPGDLSDVVRTASPRADHGDLACEQIERTCRLLTPRGPRTTVYAARAIEADGNGEVGQIVTFSDVHEQIEERRALHDARARIAAAFQASSLGIMLVGLDGIVLETNERLGAMTGLEPASLVGRPVSELLAAGYARAEAEVRQSLLSGRRPYGRFECELAAHSGEPTRWVMANIALVDPAPDGPQYFVTELEDITARRLAEEQLAYAALHDSLTGLPNRVLLMDRLKHALRRAERTGGSVAVLFLDVDRFKGVNDRLGHHAGDEVLRAVADSITTAARPADTISRLGGDEFVIVCEDLTSTREAVQVAERCRRAIAAPRAIDGTSVRIQSSIGIAFARGTYTDPDVMLRDADAAMYEAKAQGRGRCVVFDERMGKRLTARRTAELQLEEAVERGDFVVHYQPIVRLDSGAVTGVEALLRWQPPAGPWVLPADFIGLAEQSGLIREIGTFVLSTACADAVRWDYSARELRMSVNVSARQLSGGDFPRLVQQVLQDTGLRPDTLCVELTESVLVESGAVDSLNELRELGLHVAIDDFGTGFSSLAYLRTLPVDVLKIDRMFLADLPGSTRDLAIVTGIVHLGRAMALQVVAEGVERPDQVDTLLDVGCQYAQGFLLGQSGPAAVVLDPARPRAPR